MAVAIYELQRRDYHVVIRLLEPLLPYSLPLYRILQLPYFYPNSYLLSTFDPLIAASPSQPYALLFYEYRTETKSSGIIFSSLQLEKSQADSHSEEQIFALLSTLRSLKPKAKPDDIWLATVHSSIESILAAGGAITNNPHRRYGKYAYQLKDLGPRARLGDGDENFQKLISDMNKGLPTGLTFDFINEETDLPRIIETNEFVNSREDILGLPNVVIREINSKRPVCWCFVGREGSMRTVYCEPDYRRRGLGQSVGDFLTQAAFLNFSKPFPFALQDKSGAVLVENSFSSVEEVKDGKTSSQRLLEQWMHQDVSPDNAPSLALVKSGKGRWIQDSYWIRIDLGKIDDVLQKRRAGHL